MPVSRFFSARWESRYPVRDRWVCLVALEALPACLLRFPAGHSTIYYMSTDVTITPDGIRALRKRLGFTQAQLGVEVGLTQEAVAAWETGRAKPRGSARLLLAQLEARADLMPPPVEPFSGNSDPTVAETG